MTGPRRVNLDEKAVLTPTQAKMFDMLAEAYRADVAVEIASKTRMALAEDLCTASRTVATALVRIGLADYSPGHRFLLLTERGKRHHEIPARVALPT